MSGGDAVGRALAALPGSHRVHLDVRENIRRGEEPLARIMGAVKGLADGQVLVLRAPFEPVPLYAVLAKRGLAHWTERDAPGDWSVWFYPETAPPVPPTVSSTVPPTVLDVRGLEPPEPLVRILEEIDRLAPGDQIEVHHERRPVFLYAMLDERGFIHETDEPAPGLVRIRIRRAGA